MKRLVKRLVLTAMIVLVFQLPALAGGWGSVFGGSYRRHPSRYSSYYGGGWGSVFGHGYGHGRVAGVVREVGGIVATQRIISAQEREQRRRYDLARREQDQRYVLARKKQELRRQVEVRIIKVCPSERKTNSENERLKKELAEKEQRLRALKEKQVLEEKLAELDRQLGKLEKQ